MTKTREIQNFYHRLFELKEKGYNITIDGSSSGNYVAYFIGKLDGNAEYKDCVIMYNGDHESKSGYEENVCSPEEIPSIDLLREVDEIVSKIDKVFS